MKYLLFLALTYFIYKFLKIYATVKVVLNQQKPQVREENVFQAEYRVIEKESKESKDAK